MLVKMVFKSKHFEKMESLVMKGNHPLVTYGRTFVIVLTARRKNFFFFFLITLKSKPILVVESNNIPQLVVSVYCK